MKFKTFSSTFLLAFLFTIASYATTTNANEQYFIITDSETGKEYQVFNIEAKLQEIKTQDSSTSYALYINGSITIDKQTKCIGLTIYSDNPNLLGKHQNPNNFFPCFNGWGDYVYQNIPSIEISKFGDIGDFIDINYNGSYRINNTDAVSKTCSGKIHVIRNE